MDLTSLNNILTIIFTSLNVLVSICFFVLVFYNSCKGPSNYMPKHLKMYFAFCIKPWGNIIILFSLISGIYFLITFGYDDLTFKIFRFILTLSTQQIRLSYLLLIVGRIFSTLFYKFYAKHSSFGPTVILIISTFAISAFHGYFEFWRLLIDANIYTWTHNVAVVTHIATLILCRILYSVNQGKYKSLAYQSSLAHRHQIYENVKILKILSPFIYSFSIIAPLGPLALVAYKAIFGTRWPPSLFYLSYNISFLVMIYWFYKKSNGKQGKTHRINAIGHRLPPKHNGSAQTSAEIIPVDKYFDDLKLQWK